MKPTLIILTGAPASGKLTIAGKVLNEEIKLFHNHLTVDLALSLFTFGSEPYVRLCEKLRKVCITAAFQDGIKYLIFTFCYEGKVDIPFLESIETIAKEMNVTTKYVHIKCDREILLSRVANEERKKYGKLNNEEKLLEILNTWECENPVPYKNSIIIDNTGLTMHQAATEFQKIISAL